MNQVNVERKILEAMIPWLSNALNMPVRTIWQKGENSVLPYCLINEMFTNEEGAKNLYMYQTELAIRTVRDTDNAPLPTEEDKDTIIELFNRTNSEIPIDPSLCISNCELISTINTQELELPERIITGGVRINIKTTKL